MVWGHLVVASLERSDASIGPFDCRFLDPTDCVCVVADHFWRAAAKKLPPVEDGNNNNNPSMFRHYHPKYESLRKKEAKHAVEVLEG